MDTLQSIFKQRGQEFLDNLMNNELTVVEKVNTSLLSFKKIRDRELEFYKGNGLKDSSVINLVDETGSTFYKQGINFIKNFSDIVKDKCPENWTFVFLYFPSNKTSFIEYSDLPVNGLALKSIFTDNGTCIDDVETLESWANTFNTGYIKPVFQGFLNAYQKEQLLDYIEGRIKSVDCFSKFIINLLNIDKQNSAYQTDFGQVVDSFVFSFKTNNGIKRIAAKLVDPMMIDLIQRDKISIEHDATDIAIADFALFVNNLDIKDYIPSGKSKMTRYISIMCELFNDYIKYKKDQLEDFEPDSNKTLKESLDDKFTVDLDKIKNETTKRILKESDSLKKVFRALLGVFQKPLSPDYNSILITPNIMKIVNNIVSKIDGEIEKEEVEVDDISFDSFKQIINASTVDTKDIPASGQDAIEQENFEQNVEPQLNNIVKSFKEFKSSISNDADKTQNKVHSIEDSIKELQDKLKEFEKKDSANKTKKDIKSDVTDIQDTLQDIKSDIKKLSTQKDKSSDTNTKEKDNKETKEKDDTKTKEDIKTTDAKEKDNKETKEDKETQKDKSSDTKTKVKETTDSSSKK